MQTFIPVKAEDLADSLGLPHGKDGLPTRAAVADAIRKYIMARRTAPMNEVGGWLEALALSAGYPRCATGDRFRSVCRQLAAVGDLALISSGGTQHLVAVDPVTINIDLEYDLFLGDTDLGGALIHTDNEILVRRTPNQDSSVDLLEHVPPPPWASITKQLGLVEGMDPDRILESLLEVSLPPPLEPLDEAGLETLVELDNPAVKLCVGSRESGSVPVVSFRNTSGNEIWLQVNAPDMLAWIYLSQTGVAGVASWPDTLAMPDSLLSILTMVGTPADDSLRSWHLDETGKRVFSDWTGMPLPEVASATGDPEQAKVIKAPESQRLLVSAGPGSGKTWTACNRIANLIEGGAIPSRILVVSFTRAAVAEIRSRVASFLNRPADAYEINIQTLDSLAWSLNVGAGSGGNLANTDFEAGISAALSLLEAGEDWLLDGLERYQHVVIDEAQDLTGSRRLMILALLQRLDLSCGVTVFHDPAQSIYRFVEDDLAGIETKLDGFEPAFGHVELKGNYRCKSSKLQNLFAKGRGLFDSNALTAMEAYQCIRNEIEQASEPLTRLDPRSDEGNTFHLFRWRGQLTSAVNQALRSGRRVRTRPLQNRTLIQPWIAATLGSASGVLVSEMEFHHLYSALHPYPGKPAKQAWQTLRQVCSGDRGVIDLRKLAELMQSGAPVAELAIADIGPRTAPLYSTIHAAKGREAEVVVLGIPSVMREEEEEDILEEARVLYVGATRASRKLKMAASPRSMKTLPGSNKRQWRAWTKTATPAAFVEVGLAGDIAAEALSGGRGENEEANTLLWRNAEKTGRAVVSRSRGNYQIRMASDPEGPVLATLSDAFDSDLTSIGKELTGGQTYPSAKIDGAFIVGSSSVATGDDPESLRFSLAPILAGTPLVFFNRA